MSGAHDRPKYGVSSALAIVHNVHFLNFSMETSNPTGLMVVKMVGGMLAYFSEFESHMIGQRKRHANKVARQQGRPTNHRVKPGWKIAGPPGKRRIVPDEEERATMRTIVDWPVRRPGNGRFR